MVSEKGPVRGWCVALVLGPFRMDSRYRTFKNSQLMAYQHLAFNLRDLSANTTVDRLKLTTAPSRGTRCFSALVVTDKVISFVPGEEDFPTPPSLPPHIAFSQSAPLFLTDLISSPFFPTLLLSLLTL